MDMNISKDAKTQSSNADGRISRTAAAEKLQYLQILLVW